MSMKTLSRLTAVLGIWSSLLVVLLVGLYIKTGVSQEYFESTHPAAEYTKTLIRQAGLLNVTFSLDNLFLISYGAFFVGLAVLFRHRTDPFILKVAVGALLLAALFDSVENHHITAMAQAALAGIPLFDGEIRAQVVISSLKFHASCFSSVLFAVAIPRETRLGHVVTWLYAAYGFCGILVLTSPQSLILFLSLLRTVSFFLSFLLVGILLWNWVPDGAQLNVEQNLSAALSQ